MGAFALVEQIEFDVFLIDEDLEPCPRVIPHDMAVDDEVVSTEAEGLHHEVDLDGFARVTPAKAELIGDDALRLQVKRYG